MTHPRVLLTCGELIAFIDAYLDETLPGDERTRFEKHLSLCPDCANYLESYRETLHLEGDLARHDGIPESVPEDLVAAILSSRRR